ncbi:MAG: SUMF1/EgtB/PvdO family nonheme iron enzyme [Rhodothermales bacterium]|nr:SUMF1/EgtB/PvdO family nonheme iron enzyme [Rhodothermales bacterium]MBO6779212.1 SUMF1/EgtB/PvdO family nonheme iron enzyme [Rhodothermales bacterium]
MRRLVLTLFTAALLTGCASLKESRRAERIGIEWVTIPGERFVMGDTAMIENPDALPLHEVDLTPYALTRYETTYHQYDAFARATERRMPGDVDGVRGDRAVVDVDWEDASAFCAWIGGRLPSEAEWEFAAGGGVDKQVWAGTNDEAEAGDYVRYRGNANAHPAQVGRKKPNQFGLYDMSGNVSEWIGAYYQYYPEPGEEPSRYDLETFDIRILRGGDFTMELEVARTYWRAGTLKDVRSNAIGFRCARDLD